MYVEESIFVGGLGIWLAFGLFFVTVVVGIGVFTWYLKGQKEREIRESAQAERRLDVATDPDLFSAPGVQGVSPDPEPPLSRTGEPARPAAKIALPDALSKTRASLFGRIQSLFAGKATLSDSEREELEEVLYMADLGPKTVQDLLDHVFEKLKVSGETGFDAVRRELHTKMGEILSRQMSAGLAAGGQRAGDSKSELADGLDRLNLFSHQPSVLMVVGVNGAGKTTTIGKLASKFAGRGKRVLVAAGDTFRAAAGEQLKTWTDRAATRGADEVNGPMVEIFDPPGVSEPSAVAYQALERARASKFDIVIIDTAGRLHTQKNLMEELKKMKRVLAKLDGTAPHETLLVLDANSGQNALIQAKEFHGALDVDGVVLTKLDGSAKGGVAIGISHEVGLPIKLIGVGEKIDDLRPFEPRGFVDSILG